MSSSSAKVFIQLSGAPGSGKSTLARQLRPHLNAVIIDHDVLRSSLLTANSFNDAAKQAYTLQWDLAEDFLKQNIDTVIIDCACNYTEILDQGASLAAQFGYSYWYVECQLDDVDLLDQRLRARPAMASQRRGVEHPPPAAHLDGGIPDEDSHALFKKWMCSPARPENNHIILVDSTAIPEVLCDLVLERIRNSEGSQAK